METKYPPWALQNIFKKTAFFNVLLKIELVQYAIC